MSPGSRATLTAVTGPRTWAAPAGSLQASLGGPAPAGAGGRGPGRPQLVSWTLGRLGGTSTRSGSSGPWHVALQVCPVPSGSSSCLRPRLCLTGILCPLWGLHGPCTPFSVCSPGPCTRVPSLLLGGGPSPPLHTFVPQMQVHFFPNLSFPGPRLPQVSHPRDLDVVFASFLSLGCDHVLRFPEDLSPPPPRSTARATVFPPGGAAPGLRRGGRSVPS